MQGFNENPQLLALNAAREALLRQADSQAAQLLPSLGIFAEGGYGQTNLSNFGVKLQGCCGATHIPVRPSATGRLGRGIEEQNHKPTNLYFASNPHLAPLPSTME